MKLKDWLFLVLVIILFSVSMFYPKQKENESGWHECYSISFLNGETMRTCFTSSREDEYSNKSIKIKFEGGLCHVKILTWRNIEENLTLMRETSNIVVNYK